MDRSTAELSLVANDNEKFTLPAKAAAESKFLENAISKYFENADEDGWTEPTELESVECPRVSGTVLKEVVEFLVHYDEETMDEIQTPLDGTTFEEVMTQEWYRNFADRLDRNMLFALLTAANYMIIKPLLDLCCLKVTFMLTNKSKDEIREILSLPELSAEEEAQARERHGWIFEDGN